MRLVEVAGVVADAGHFLIAALHELQAVLKPADLAKELGCEARVLRKQPVDISRRYFVAFGNHADALALRMIFQTVGNGFHQLDTGMLFFRCGQPVQQIIFEHGNPVFGICEGQQQFVQVAERWTKDVDGVGDFIVEGGDVFVKEIRRGMRMKSHPQHKILSHRSHRQRFGDLSPQLHGGSRIKGFIFFGFTKPVAQVKDELQVSAGKHQVVERIGRWCIIIIEALYILFQRFLWTDLGEHSV